MDIKASKKGYVWISETGSKRIREKMDEKNLTDDRLAGLLGSSGTARRNALNQQRKGKRSIAVDDLKTITEILEIENWKALAVPDVDEGELLQGEYAALQQYLKFAGIEITPGYYWDCYRHDALKHFDLMRQFFMPEEKRRLLTVKEKLEENPKKLRRVRRETIALICDPFTSLEYLQAAEPDWEPDIPFSTLPPLDDLDYIAYRLKTPLGGYFFVGYEIRENRKKTGVITYQKLLTMMVNVRASAKALALAPLQNAL